MTPEDPGIWKEALSGLVAGMGALIAWLFKKVDGSASKTELSEAIAKADKNIERALAVVEKTNDEWRLTTKQLYANAELDRMQNNERFGKMQDRIHDAYSDLAEQVHSASTSANQASAAAAAILATIKKK